jgi:CelD/BcsL family acetyltransferase involved in cellulose biosynthesis
LFDRLSFQDLEDRAEIYDAAVARTTRIDRFCTSSFWILPAVHCLLPASIAPLVATESEGGSYVVLARSLEPDGSSVLHPLEATWGLASPLVGPDADAAVELFLSAVVSSPPWRLALVTGLMKGSALWRSLARRAARRFPLFEGPQTRRYVADLSAGVDGFLARRSAGFRKNLMKAERRAAGRGLAFEVHDEDPELDAVFERILAVERRSWKGRDGVGIDREPMRSLYREMHRRLWRRRALRVAFARIDGEDAAYVLGGIFLDTYRGLQFSYDARRAALSLGSLCQLHEIRRLVGSGVTRSDLGTEVRYKKRWGEEVVTTHSLVLRGSS